MSRPGERPLTVVVGAGPGVAAAFARRQAAAGHDVALVGRDAARLGALAEQVAQDVAGHGARVDHAAADAADADGLTDALRRLVGPGGRVDVLHHNVSTYREGTATATTAADLLADVAAGAGSLLTAVRAVLPELLDGGGTVLATGGASADRPAARAATLGMQKAALRNLVLALDGELRQRGVHVATVTVDGVLGSARGPAHDEVAAVLAELAAETAGPVEGWRTEVRLAGS